MTYRRRLPAWPQTTYWVVRGWTFLLCDRCLNGSCFRLAGLDEMTAEARLVELLDEHVCGPRGTPWGQTPRQEAIWLAAMAALVESWPHQAWVHPEVDVQTDRLRRALQAGMDGAEGLMRTAIDEPL